MSGAEFIAVAGVISSIIAVVDGISQVVDAASEVEGLPKAFRQASYKLTLVSDILEATKHNFEADNVSGVEKSVTLVDDDCKDKWKTLNDLFDKVIPEEKASRVDRYYKAVKTLGKGGKVESLMKGILEDIQLLATIKTMTTTNVEKVIKTVTAAQEEKVANAITDVAAWPPSVPDDGEAKQYHSGGGPQTINEVQTIINGILNISLLRECPLIKCHMLLRQDDREKLIQTKGLRVDGTCEWIKTNKLYNSWIHSHSQLLWLSGGPGKGKTMLSIFLAEELERTAKDSQDLLQLRPKLFDHILLDFEIQRSSLFTSSSFETLWRIFETMVRDLVIGTTYCILDGLDECDEASSEVLLWKFKALFSAKFSESSACHLNLIVVSRNLPDFIRDVLSGFPCIRLDTDADSEVTNDIHRFIEVKVDELSAAHRHYPERLRGHIKEVFRSRAQGTFLWVGIVAKELWGRKPTEVEKALDLFPPGLDELYARMLFQIDINRRETAAKLLRWVVMAVRPLSLSELRAAIEPAVQHPTILSPDEVIKDQVSFCGYFLTIKEEEVGLIHQSAKDYLLRETPNVNPELEVFRVKKEVGNLEIARKCLDCLQSRALAGGKVDLRTNFSHLKEFPLLRYAAIHWPEHARSLARSENIFNLFLPFYDKKSRIRESWLKTYWAVKEDSEPPDSFTLLHLASYFGILPLAENLLKTGLVNWMKCLQGLNKKDKYGMTALVWAARGGHEAVVRLLLEKGANVEAKGDYKRTALVWAAWGKHEAVVRLLLEKGADVEVKGDYKRTALV
ncbi:hypothetical protein DL98DRAFT_658902 [Cadophora sp. DSE1049]|nr:hypothetical protein DL98DRAFT_658902 [Cadophora sp. DSE1049]